MTEVAINFRKTAYYLSFSPKAALFTVTKLKTKKTQIKNIDWVCTITKPKCLLLSNNEKIRRKVVKCHLRQRSKVLKVACSVLRRICGSKTFGRV